ncbi:P-loop containing nucleoside triphosphate hydrolase protein [Pisolithus marmoratus]|nr:P-loop containing nucleoside triphosphate hydrolase protein [Pisolithus marmoratus]
MRLHTLIPTIPADLVSALESCGIKTDTDLLFFDGSNIELFAKLPRGLVTCGELEKYVALVAEHASPPGIRGDEELEAVLRKQRENALELSSGVGELDELVGGFGGGRVFEISGEKESGKTALALQVSLRLLIAHPDTSVLWMDTCGDFSVDRTARVANELGAEDVSAVLERLQVALVLNIEDAHGLVADLRERADGGSSAGGPRVRCVVIDSITPLLAPSLSNISAQGHATMTTFMQDLRDFARTHYLTFLVVNDTSAVVQQNSNAAFTSAARKPALGPSFTFLTDCTLWLSKHGEVEGESASMHDAEVLRSRMTRSETRCTFKIRGGVLYSAIS